MVTTVYLINDPKLTASQSMATKRRVLVTLIAFAFATPAALWFSWGFVRDFTDTGYWSGRGWKTDADTRIAIEPGIDLVTLHLKRGTDAVHFRIVRFDEERFELLVVDNGSARAAPHFKNLEEAMSRANCRAGSNGGFFDPATFEPNGWMVANGKTTGDFRADNWADGMVVVEDGRLALEARQSFRDGGRISQLLQTGPWLVRNSSAESRFDDDRRARRTFIGSDGEGSWILGCASEVSLRQLSAILCTGPIRTVIPVQNALNLDGGPSSGLWVNLDDGPPVYVREETIVRNYIGLRRRTELR